MSISDDTAAAEIHLQRAVASPAAPGNLATPTPGALQRQEPPKVDNVAKLDELLGKLITPREEVIKLLGEMTPAEKHTVLVGYGDKLGKALNVSQMKRALTNLGAELPVALDWIQKASLLTILISYSDIQALVTAAPQAERDTLKNERWKSFFLSVCDNKTIITAVTDLHFDLPTQITWIRGEASALLSLDLAKLKPLLTAAPQAELDIVGGEAFRSFWVDVCTNETMAELVDILFPKNLVKKLEWMEVEGADFPQVMVKVKAAPQDQRDMLKNDRWKKFFLSVCDNTTIITAVTELHFDLATQITWIRGEASALLSLNLAKLKPLLAAAPQADLDIIGGEAFRSFWVDVCTNETMAELVDILFAKDLVKKLEWMDVEGADFAPVMVKVKAASQPERDMLKNDRWKKFFLSLCDNTTIITAVTELHFDLPTQITWIRGEASALLSLTLAKLKTLLTAASQADIDIVGGEAFRSFWVDVCNDQTMAELVDILFPKDLGRRLVWMDVEGTTLPVIQAKVAAADAASKLTVFGNAYVQKMMLALLNNTELVTFVLDLGGDWGKWRDWVMAKGVKFKELAAAAVTRTQISDATALAFANLLLGGVAAKKVIVHLRNLPDAPLATLRADPMALDLINELYVADQVDITKALNGESKSATATPSVSETLQAGSTKSPFVPTPFALSPKFSIAYRDKLDVNVGVAVTAAAGDTKAATLLPAALGIWSGNILGAWNNKFKLKNSDREIPIRFNLSLTGGPNPVTAHSGVWAWPKLNATNWFVPDSAIPGQMAAVSTAPIHEFGHLIGNQDEYMLSAAHYVAVTGKVAATDPNAIPETDPAGTKRYSNSLSVMGTGGPVLAMHLTPVLNVVNANLLPGEPAFAVVPV